MKFSATVLTTYWVRTSLSLLIPAILAGFLFLADSYLNADSESRAIWLLGNFGADVSIEEAVDAAGKGKLFSLDMLHRAGVDLGQTGDSGYTPLIASLRGDSRFVADYLIRDFAVERTLHIESKDTGITAFGEAAHSGRFLLADQIRRIENELNGMNHPGLKDILKNGGDPSGDYLYSCLRPLGVDPDEAVAKWGRNLPLVLAVEREDGARIRQEIDFGANVETVGPDGNTLLVGAILKNNHDLVMELIEAGAQIDPEQSGEKHLSKNASPLESAILGGDLRLVELILRCGASPNRMQSMKITPLGFAIQKKNTSLAAMLIASGADFSDPELSFSALQNGDKTCLELLLKTGVSPDLKNKAGTRLLEQALILDSIECAELLIHAGADISGSLAFALHSDSADLVELLLSHGADLDELGGEDGSALLDYAFRTDNMKLVGILLKHGASLDSISRDGGALLAVPVSEKEKREQSVSLEVGTKTQRIALDFLP